MKKNIKFYLYLFSIVLFAPATFAEIHSTNSSTNDPRQDAHTDASIDLKNLNFFQNGEGMQVGAGFLSFWNSIKSKNIISQFAKNIFEKDAGIIFDQNKNPIGVEEISYKNLNISTVLCSSCHFGKAYGQIIPGLGNKNIDIAKFVEIAKKLKPFVSANNLFTRQFDTTTESINEYIQNEKKVSYFFKRLTHQQTQNTTQGLIPVGIVRASFYPNPFNLPENYSKSEVKIPHLWGYGEKRKFGAFYDGFGDASIGAWASALSLVAGQSNDIILSQENINKLIQAEEIFSHLLPPKYPLPINLDDAQLGEKIFENKCMKCHQNYEKDNMGHPIYLTPKPVPIEKVKTDPDLFNGTTDEFIFYVNNSELSEILKFSPNYNKNQATYLAPRLEGIWARFPYLHNGSVPTLDDLLNKRARPTYFSLQDAGEVSGFDPLRIGLARVARTPKEIYKFKQLKLKGHREIYSTEVNGLSNQGHNYFLEDEDRKYVIEYLKTL